MVAPGLNFLYLLADYDWIVFADLVLSEFFVVKFTVVFIRVAVFPAVEAAATTVKASEADLALARLVAASVSLSLVGAEAGAGQRGRLGRFGRARRRHCFIQAHGHFAHFALHFRNRNGHC